MNKKNILFVGNSNVRAIKDCFSEESDAAIDPTILWIKHESAEFRPIVVLEKKQLVLNKNIDRFIKQAAPEVIVSLIGGHDHSYVGLMELPEKFDFVDPALGRAVMCHDNGDRQLIPYQALKKMMRTRMVHYEVFLAKLAGYKVPVFHIESPPPKQEAYILKSPGIFKDQLALGIAPIELRFKLWRLYSEIKMDLCKAAGITYVAVPQSIYPNMTLSDQYCFADSIHANASFGKVMIAELKREMRLSRDA